MLRNWRIQLIFQTFQIDELQDISMHVKHPLNYAIIIWGKQLATMLASRSLYAHVTRLMNVDY